MALVYLFCFIFCHFPSCNLCCSQAKLISVFVSPTIGKRFPYSYYSLTFLPKWLLPHVTWKGDSRVSGYAPIWELLPAFLPWCFNLQVPVTPTLLKATKPFYLPTLLDDSNIWKYNWSITNIENSPEHLHEKFPYRKIDLWLIGMTDDLWLRYHRLSSCQQA